MQFADLALSRRLEQTEGYAGLQFAIARLNSDPDCKADFLQHAGTIAVFDGPDSPITQSFGLGLSEEFTAESLNTIEAFFRSRGASPTHEVSPFAGAATLAMLCQRGYTPIEISSVLHRTIDAPASPIAANIHVRLINPGEEKLWAGVSAKGWSHEYPELALSVEQFGALAALSQATSCFLAEWEGTPAAAGVLILHEGVALFGGAATVFEYRRKGLQSALLNARMRYAVDAGCNLAMMVTEAGSNSQRNSERQGFRIAYTRMKWRR